MKRTLARRARVAQWIEDLESRRLLAASIATTTTLSAPPTTAVVGQTISLTVNIASSDGTAVSGGRVDLLNSGTATGFTATVGSTGNATFTLAPGDALYAGSYSFSAQFLGNTIDLGSTSAAVTPLTVSLPRFTTSSDGLGVATITQGSGTAATAGQSVTLLYSGFFSSTGAEFDESSTHTPASLTFTLGATPLQVISGLNEGATGIEVGETRVLQIPSALGYKDGQTRIYVIQGVQSATSSGAGTKLLVAANPSSAIVDEPLVSPVLISVTDASNALVATDTSIVTLSLTSAPSGGNVAGATSVAAVDGQASFGALQFSTPGTYTFTASDGSLTSATFSIKATAIPTSSIVASIGAASLPGTLVAGSRLAVKVPVYIANNGKTLKGRYHVQLFVDNSTALNGRQVLLDSTYKDLDFEPHKTDSFKFDLDPVISTLSPGTYHIVAEVVAPGGAISTAATTQAFTELAAYAKPAASVGAVTPVSIAPRGSGKVAVTVTNIGTFTSRELTILLNPSPDGRNPNSNLVLATLRRKEEIKPGSSKTFDLTFKASTALGTGTFYPYATVQLDSLSTKAAGSVFTVS